MFGQADLKVNPVELPSLVLAYIGDAVYELAVREYLINRGLTNVNKLHREAVRHVRASTQARVFHALEGCLDKTEEAVARRGRNAKSGHGPRGNNIIEYRHSTGFESLVGYLYLQRDWARLEKILSLAREVIEQELDSNT
ncbi:Mini-ribonuclease 3 [Desulfoscipio geothermicus]|jgi:ribonuclease-3 family protein|uniref:Mini-ribonuclease 3 n=1 Tax=Desulfoscipio geothermicus DSM 3669 TaxID=1121426 RepID=A0A1I6DV92_9FIRM|nr:ribonuclease III domain-containing protein [Desulfoscipio geothermicus]SFR09430.1 ribonuclease-3 family protein [Desulfoscipio geothermicus DSM 3669]